MNIKNPCNQCIVKPMCTETCKASSYFSEFSYILFKFVMAIIFGVIGIYCLVFVSYFEKQLGLWLLLALIIPNWILSASIVLLVQSIKEFYKLQKGGIDALTTRKI